MKLSITLFLIATMLSGCAHFYSVPAGAPTAKIRFTSNVALGRQIFIFANEQCELGPNGGSIGYVGGMGSGEASKLAMKGGGEPSNRVIERVIEAGRPLVFSFIHQYNTTGLGVLVAAALPKTCTVTTVFTPKPGTEYEAVYTHTDKICEVSVSELTQDAGGVVLRVPDPTARKATRECGLPN